ncbi:MAG: c-type cytochrome [Flavisolibacter sp.]
MNQIKYILSACLILLMISAAIFLYRTFQEEVIIAENETAYMSSSYEKRVAVTPVRFSDSELEGKSLFDKHCNSCHAIEKTDDFLEAFQNRGPWKDRNELYKWIHDPEGYMTHDPTGYTVGLKEKYQVSMLPTRGISNQEIDKTIDYMIKASGQ